MSSNADFYKELYHYEGTKNTLVVNELSGDVAIKKTLKYFDVTVFEYLKNNTNPHIPKVFDFWEDGENLVVIEEYIKGLPLDEYLEQDKVSRSRKHQIVNDICDGLIFLHSCSKPIIHRDIKSSNIMITDEGVVKVIDFDAAKIYKDKSQKDTTLIGTEGSAAPEQYGFAQSDVRTDIYALGVLVREILPKDSSAQRVSAKATKIDPSDRYPSVKAFKNAFNKSIKSLWPLPGFRTHNPLKSIIATLVYIGAFFIIYNFDFNGDGVRIAIDSFSEVFLLLLFILEVDIITDWTGIWSFLPFMRSEKPVIKYLATFVYCVLMFFALLIVLALLVVLFEAFVVIIHQ